MGSGLRRRMPLLIAAVVGVVLVAVVRQVSGGGGGGGGAGGGDSASGGTHQGCVPVRVVASSEKAALLKEVAADYNRSPRSEQRRCAEVTVSSKASGGAAEALARGWDERVDGPRPDVWSPASSSWAVLLRQRTTAQDKPDLVPAKTPSIAQTPLVIAMPRPMAEALGWPDRQLGWSDLVALAKDPKGWGSHGHPEWGRFTLGKTNPNFSTSGLNATIGTYFAATGRSSDLSVADVKDPKVRDFVRGVERTVVHYGDTTLTFLSNLYAAGQRGQGLNYISAVTVEEKSVWDYNQGNPTGDPATAGKQPRPAVPLAAIYPKEGTLVSDNPYIVLTASWVDAAKREAAADFLDFIRQPAQQKRFADAAFRDFDGKPGAPITPANGMLPDHAFQVIDPPAPEVLDQVSRSWEELRKRARVLMVIDVSGSMGSQVTNSTASKLELAKRAAHAALAQLQPDDQLGLWSFSTAAPGESTPYRILIPPAPVSQISGRFNRTIDDLVPGGGTALYNTIRAAAAQGMKDFDPERINAVVVLTDGKNEYPKDDDLSSLLSQLSGEDTDRTVRVFPIAYGAQSDLDVLTKIGQASRASTYDARDPASIEKVMVNVFSNF